ncbi:flagellin [Oceanisphaera psychrotolerans]|uniref:Flagellin n=1 Tax=Oceanisphaera psychrotolerans TaxID=1414654 RepID=A0A1J4QDQ1_9GAMM|nr:flagellin [Oceanisphaera psychrotolerans]OIN07722.1 hypothetical protein BFR47_03710 [Oceanisphaera psychrotolerans]
MAITVNSNVSAMSAQRNLTNSSNALASSMERLSTGSRINSAKDDAAGLQISNRLNSQVRGLGVAMKNASDGISMAQTAEGAMQESTSILQRMRDLALQSANGSNTSDDRAAMQKEISSLQSELTRIAETTSFGGQKLLDGSFGSRAFQVGSKSNEAINMTLSDVSANKIGLEGKSLSATALTGFGGISASGYTKGTSDSLSVQIGSSTKQVALRDGMSAADLAGEYNSVSGLSGVSGFTGVKVEFSANTNAGDTVALNVQGVEISYAMGADAATTEDNLTAALDQSTLDALSDKGITTEVVNNEGVIFKDANGDNINISASVTAGATEGGTIALQMVDIAGADVGAAFTIADTDGAQSRVITGQLDFSNAILDNDYGAVTVTAAGALGAGAVTVGSTARTSYVSAIDISSAGGSQSAIDVIDAAIGQIDDQRADLGAFQNRLDSTINNLANIRENASAGMSRIMDVDFAEETVNLTKQQILQQAGTSILAQAKQIPQAALSLLG